MKNKLTPFQAALYGFLIIVIIIGVIVFSTTRRDGGKAIAPVTAWGTFSDELVNKLLEEIDDVEKDSVDLTYVEYSEEEFESAMIEALASGEGPDILFMPDEFIVKHANKLQEIDYEFYPQSTFKNNFIEAGDVLLTNTGILGLPYTVDPLVLYWNRTMLNAAGISIPPQTWDQFTNLSSRLVKKNENLNIQKAAVALGEYRNIEHAKDILITLLRQAGNPVVSREYNDQGDLNYVVSLDDRLGYTLRPADAVMSFYTQFSDPSLNTYSWNRSLPSAKEMFLAGDLAFYVGYASEFTDIQRRNPNLNFDVAVIPQSLSDEDNVSVNGSMIFIGLVKNSPNLEAAFDTAVKLTSKTDLELLAGLNNLPPVRRDMLVNQNDNAILQTFYDSALITKVFLDPNPQQTDEIFLNMVESYTSGRSTLGQVILRAQSQLTDLFR